MRLSKGAELLAAHMKRAGENQSDLARVIGMPAPGLVGRWLRGERKPGTAFAGKLLEHCSIPLIAWGKPASKKFERRVVAAAA